MEKVQKLGLGAQGVNFAGVLAIGFILNQNSRELEMKLDRVDARFEQIAHALDEHTAAAGHPELVAGVERMAQKMDTVASHVEELRDEFDGLDVRDVRSRLSEIEQCLTFPRSCKLKERRR